MPSTSHSKCKVCRAVIHARHRFGMCKRCSDKHYARLQAQRKETKQRQARRQAALVGATAPVLEEGPDMPDETKAPPDKRERRPHAGLTDDQRVEILDAYTQTTESVNDITARYGIKGTYIYNILDRVGVSWRRGNPESYETWQARQQRSQTEELLAAHGLTPLNMHDGPEETVPEPVEKALENMLKLPPKPEPVAPTPAIERRAATQLAAFDVTVEGRLRVRAVDMLHAIQMVMTDHPDLRITQISEV